MNSKILESDKASQWKDVKISGGSKAELTKAVAQIRSQVKNEHRVFAAFALSSDVKNKPPK